MPSDPKRPERPHPDILNEAIPLFFIGRNENGFWVALNADGSAGGIFLLKRSALWFAHRKTQPWGCATMVVPEPLELGIANEGNLLLTRFVITSRYAYPLVLMIAIFGGLIAATLGLRLALWPLAAFLLKAT
jgi:hypothetical protein